MQVDDILVFDAETSLHNERGKFKAHPQCKDNWIVWMGVASLRTDTLEMAAEPTLVRYKDIKSVEILAPVNPSRMLLVGHNIGFDLHYLLNVNNRARDGWIDYINDQDSLIWDTQIAEYRLRGQSVMSPSLDGVCEARGWETKPGRLKEYWANGISTEDIPDEEVRPYLKHDVSTTAKLFRAQIIEAAEKGMLDMLRIEMQSRLTTILMEHNGMAFQAEAALKENAEVIAPRLKLVEAQALAALRVLTKLPEVAVKPNSTTFLKQFLYGGTVKWREQHPMMDENGDPVLFKSGKKKGEAKLKWHDKEQVLPAASPLAGTKADEDMLNKIQAHSKCSADLSHALSLVLEFRDLNKQSSTYFEGYAALTWEDGMIHGNLNHAIAATGRLSSTNPNLQNAGHSPIRAHFKSRYPGGHLMEVDLSQIEVVVQAVLSADVNMRNDIINGIDFHSKRAAFAHNADYSAVKQAVDDALHPEHDTWTKIRKGAKIVSFQKAYGAGVKKISETTGLSRNAVKAFMDAEDQNYPSVPMTAEHAVYLSHPSMSSTDSSKIITTGILTSSPLPSRTTRYRASVQTY